MKARPILFSGPMVRALLEGRKTQTRRVVKPQPSTHHWQKSPGYIGDYRHEGDNLWHFAHRIPQNPTWDCDRQIACPYGKPGDLLWVRETFSQHPQFADLAYKADDDGDGFEDSDGFLWEPKYSPSIHMPRALSRLTLRITDVRVQRLRDISSEDVNAEGVSPGIPGCGGAGDYRHTFMRLWESINGPGSWDANPWVWALTFEVIKANTDQVGQ